MLSQCSAAALSKLSAPAFMLLLCLLLCGADQASAAGRTLYPAENPSPNGAYILCRGDNVGACYELRDVFRATNTQLEHVADRLLLRTGGTGFLATQEKLRPLTWSAPSGDLVQVILEDGEAVTWNFKPEGAVLVDAAAGVYGLFVASEREYEAAEGGVITLP